MEAVYGEERARLEWGVGQQDLRRALAELKPDEAWQGALAPDLSLHKGGDGSAVAYEKGALFLYQLERRFGRPQLDAFLQGWFDRHAFTSVTTPQFVAELQDGLMRAVPGQDRRGIPRELDRRRRPASRCRVRAIRRARSRRRAADALGAGRARRPMRCRPALDRAGVAALPEPCDASTTRCTAAGARPALPVDRIQQCRDRACLVPAGACERLPGPRACAAKLPCGHRAIEADRAVVRRPVADSARCRIRAPRVRAGAARDTTSSRRVASTACCRQHLEATPVVTAGRIEAPRVRHRCGDHRRALRPRARLRAGRGLALQRRSQPSSSRSCARTAGSATRHRST